VSAAWVAELPSAVLTARFSESVRWASLLHADQVRKGTDIAYVAHLLAVASLVLEDGGSEDEAIAGMLHDAVEDQSVAEAEIRSRFGAHVAEIVVACSDGVDGARDETDWSERKTAYLQHLELDALPEGVLRVTAADKLHNARSILTDLRDHGPSMWREKGFHAGAAEQRWYYVEVARVLAERHPGATTRELERVVAELVTEIDEAP
jgi:(p)ppGpp synthase/HD superfamily hydrolase